MKLRTILFVVVGVLLVLIAYRLFVPFQPSVSKTMPVHLQGTWVTSNLHYSDHYIKVDADAITFGSGGVSGKRCPVTGFDQRYEPGGDLINTVHYRDADGARSSRQFYFRPENRGELVFKNLPEVTWTRQRQAAPDND